MDKKLLELTQRAFTGPQCPSDVQSISEMEMYLRHQMGLSPEVQLTIRGMWDLATYNMLSTLDFNICRNVCEYKNKTLTCLFGGGNPRSFDNESCSQCTYKFEAPCMPKIPGLCLQVGTDKCE